MSNNYLRTRIKVCGLTREQDVLDVIELGVDAIGMVFYPNSKRYIGLDQAASLRSLIPSFVTVTALFVNPAVDFVNSVLKSVKPDLLQFHGDETPEFCINFAVPYMKAIRVGAPKQSTSIEIANFCSNYNTADALLFDSYTQAYGGSGKSFNDALLADALDLGIEPRIVLSGGLTAETVGQRIQTIKPFAVDVSSAVESAPGIKDRNKLIGFIRAVQNVDSIVK